MYNMLQGAFCPVELLAAGSKNSMLGDILGVDLPLRFSNDSGTLVMSNDFGSARVLNLSLGCQSIVFITDAVLIPPLEVDAASVAAPSQLPTLPIRHMTCNSPSLPEVNATTTTATNTTTPPENIDSSSSDTSLAIGLGVGFGCAAVIIASVAVFIIAKKRRREQGQVLEDASSSLDADMFKISPLAVTNESKNVTYASAHDVFAAERPDSSVLEMTTGSTRDADSLRAEMHTSAISSANTSGQMSKLGSNISSELALWQIDPTEIQIALDAAGCPVELGKGSSGTVYRGTLRGVQPAAIKLLLASLGSDSEAAFQQEAAILKHVNRDKNVVQLYGTSMLSDGRLLLVTELMEGGDLRCALNHPATAEKLAWHRGGKGVALDIARGLTSLHAANVIHRDLKTSNILLSTVFEAKIADVGISAIHSRGYLTASAGRVVGTFAWSAPELLMGQRCTEKVDIYSCGVMLYELATGKVPKRGALDLPSPSERCPAELLALITDCVNVNPHDRPSARDVYFRISEAVPPLSILQ